ncbi:MAG TPA: hypothetical protein VG944_13355 [Fimbriimonas sp.]|nr:hypothetical protein [Fimbriimonas sp.]
MQSNKRTLLLSIVLSILMIGALFSGASAQRRGSFGGGRSFGGGMRSFSGGGSSFRSGPGSFSGSGAYNNNNSRRYNSGSTRSFGQPGGGSSFNRSGSFGNSGRINSTSIAGAPSAYRGVSPVYQSRYYYGGGYYPSYYYGGYGDYWFHPAWYYWLPFHPAFYYSPPYMYNGAYYPGGFSFTRLILGILVIMFVLWLLSRIFGGGRGVRYTNYR